MTSPTLPQSLVGRRGRIGLAVLAASVLLAAGCRRPAETAAAPTLPVAAVRTATVERQTASRLVEVVATVRPADRATIAAQVMGPVTAVPVALGDTVTAGQVLARIAVPEIEARVARAEAALRQVEGDRAREAQLLASGASTPETVRSLTEAAAAAQAALKEAQAMRSFAEVHAPFAGQVSRRLVNPGDLAAPGAPLFELEGTGRLRAEAPVPESLARLSVGQPIAVQAEPGAQPLAGRVAEIAAAADPATRTVLVKIDLPTGTVLRSGSFVRALVPAGETTRLVVPAAAVAPAGQVERVFVVEEGRARMRLVRTGSRRDGLVEILAGVTAGETVVTEGAATLRDGQPVEAAR